MWALFIVDWLWCTLDSWLIVDWFAFDACFVGYCVTTCLLVKLGFWILRDFDCCWFGVLTDTYCGFASFVVIACRVYLVAVLVWCLHCLVTLVWYCLGLYDVLVLGWLISWVVCLSCFVGKLRYMIVLGIILYLLCLVFVYLLCCWI